MKNKIYLFLLFLSLLFIPNIAKADTNNFNLTNNITDKEGNPLPELILNEDITLNHYQGFTYWEYEENKEINYFITYDSNNNLTIIMLADYGRYNTNKYYMNYKINEEENFNIYKRPNGTYILNAGSNILQKYGTSKSIANNAEFTNIKLNSTYNYPFIIFTYNESQNIWEKSNNGSQGGGTFGFNFNGTNDPIILYSTIDLYIHYQEDGDINDRDYLLYASNINNPVLDDFDKIDLTSNYSILFKPKYDNINNNTNDLKFIFKSNTINIMNHYKNYELFKTENYSNNWNQIIVNYNDLDIIYKTDRIEFITNTIISGSTTEQGTSGGYHGEGSGRHFYYDEDNNDIIQQTIENKYIYYHSNYFDYCLKKFTDSQCYYTDGSIDNSYFTNAESSSDYINDLVSYFKEQNNYFVSFGSLIKYTFFSLPGEIRTFLSAICIMFLIYGFINLIRRK